MKDWKEGEDVRMERSIGRECMTS